MIQDKPDLISAIRARFAHVDTCPFQGPRIFFENAGGALTLKSVAQTSATYAAIPDNQGRDNPASHALVATIARARADMAAMMNAPDGQFFAGESGTELLFRMIRTACLNAPKGGQVLGSSLEHPASRSAAKRWAGIAGLEYVNVAHNDPSGTVTVDDYAPHITPETSVATILHTSPVTGIGVNVGAIAAAIRAIAPGCLIIVDGIQHAAHGQINIASYSVDGYAISPYKMFSRHGFGIAWISDRLATLPHDKLDGAPDSAWEFGTRDTGAYATMSDVVDYLDWLGAQVGDASERQDRLRAAGQAIHAYEKHLTDAMIHGTGNLAGLADMDNVTILGGADNPAREGLVSIVLNNVPSPEVVARLNDLGIRTHLRKSDHYSGNILEPLGLNDCIRVSLCHYNTEHEVAQFLAAIKEIGTG